MNPTVYKKIYKQICHLKITSKVWHKIYEKVNLIHVKTHLYYNVKNQIWKNESNMEK